MPNPNPLVAEISGKNGQVYDVAAKRFSGNRTVELTGDVSGTESGWNGSGPLTVATSIGSKKVKNSMIADKAVGTGQIDDEAVGFDQIDHNVYTNTVEENNTKLVTSGGVNAAIQNAILNRGIDYGPKTVDGINALSNIPTGSTVHVAALGSGDARVVNDGWKDGQHVSIQVRVGEDLTYYISGNDHGWYSNDGEFKLKQQAYSASGLGTLKTITSLSQDENGVMAATASDVQSASTSQKGVVQLEDSHTSTATDKAATPKNVKEAYDLANGKLSPTGDGKDVTSTVATVDNYTNPGSTATALKTLFGKIWNFIGRLRTSWQTTPDDTHFPSEKLVKDSLDTKADKVSSATSGNFAGLDANGNLTDSGSKASDFATASQGSKADSAVQGVKLDGASSALTPDANKVVTIPNAAPTGTGETNGLMTAADKAKLNGITSGANKVEASNTNGNIKIDGTETNVYTHPSAGPSSATSVGDTTNQTPAFGGTFKAISQTVNTDGHTTATAEHTVTLPTDGKDLTSTVATVDNYTNPGSTATALKTLFGKIWNFIGRLRTSWQTTPDDTHFPSEKLVKDSLDKKVPISYAKYVDASQQIYKVCSFRKQGTGGTDGLAIDVSIRYGSYSATGSLLYKSSFRLILNVSGGTSQNPVNTVKFYYVTSDSDSNYFDIYAVGSSYTRLFANAFAGINVNITFSSFGTVVGSLPTGATLINPEFVATVSDAIGSAGVPIYSDAVGHLQACTVDSAPTDSSTNLVTSGGVKTALDAKVAGPSSATADDIAVFDGTTGKLVKDGGKKISDLKTKQTAVTDPTASGTALSFIDTITQNANGEITPTKKTVSDATTSEHGLMSASDKSKLNGISDGARIYVKYVNTEGGKSYKVCSFAKVDGGGINAIGLNVLLRYGNYGISGTLIYKNGFKLIYTTTNPGSSQDSSTTVRFYWVEESSTIVLYASADKYTRLFAAPLDNIESSYVSFSDFGTEVNAIPEGATQLSKTYAATVETSSEGAPLKSDYAGNLTACTVDSAPTASSTNLVTSGGVKSAIDAIDGNVYPWHKVGGGGTTITRKVCDILIPDTNSYNGLNYIFDYGSEYNSTGNPSSTGKVKVRVKTNGASEPTYFMTVIRDAGPYQPLIDPTFKLYKKYDSTAKKLYLVLAAQVGSGFYNGLSCRINGCRRQSGDDIASHVTMATNTAYTPAEDYSEVTTNLSNIRNTYTGLSSVGSAFVPVYVDSNGEVKACTDDFARDSEVVTDVKQVTESNALKLKFTKNGSDTTFLEFMTSAETTSMIAAAKTAAT